MGEQRRDGQRRPMLAAARLALGGPPSLWGLLVRGACLGAALALAVHHPWAAVLAAAALVWVLWPAYAVARHRSPAEGLPGPGLRVRYLGGHPGLPRPGSGWLRTWAADGAAAVRVGRSAVAFPLAAVTAVSMAQGRAELRTGCRGPLAALVGRFLAHGLGRYCGLRRAGREDLALIDRSRVVCELGREGGACRMILAGPRGGGEEIYLEVLVMLRRAATMRGSGSAGGPRASGAAGGA